MTTESGARDEGNGGSKEQGEEGDGTGRTERISESFRQGIGVLSAFKEALEETIDEARDRGELSTDRAREFVKDAMGRARQAAGDAKERLDLPSREEFDRLRERVDELRVRLENLEERTPQDEDVGSARVAEEGPES